MLDILLPAFFLSLVLLGIHSYFGIEIIRKGIIFTDLAVGQMAALGAAISLLFFDGQYLYITSLIFSLLAGLLIAFASRKVRHLEAFIGLMYAFGLSGVFILLSKSPNGAEKFQDLMASDILFTPSSEITKTAILYSLLGIFIYIFNKKTTGFLKEVLFFITFSVTVTSSVKLAGVLVIFALLIGPAMIALNINRGKLVINAWIIGTIINLIAISVSYNFDFPTGYTLVCFHALIAGLCFLIFEKKSSKEQKTN
ncbi:MAG: metal ABC transporter permease [Candidatus Sericytochromatia bacterium]|nr:metal ABC transporter permease [Candidatus Sericytochromatia bacterium]